MTIMRVTIGKDEGNQTRMTIMRVTIGKDDGNQARMKVTKLDQHECN